MRRPHKVLQSSVAALQQPPNTHKTVPLHVRCRYNTTAHCMPKSECLSRGVKVATQAPWGHHLNINDQLTPAMLFRYNVSKTSSKGTHAEQKGQAPGTESRIHNCREATKLGNRNRCMVGPRSRLVALRKETPSTSGSTDMHLHVIHRRVRCVILRAGRAYFYLAMYADMHAGIHVRIYVWLCGCLFVCMIVCMFVLI